MDMTACCHRQKALVGATVVTKQHSGILFLESTLQPSDVSRHTARPSHDHDMTGVTVYCQRLQGLVDDLIRRLHAKVRSEKCFMDIKDKRNPSA